MKRFTWKLPTVISLITAVAALALFVPNVQSQSTAAPKSSATTAEWIPGEITRIDAPRKRVTLKHGPIASIKMEAMTMPFKLKDVALIEGYKIGDKLQFTVVNDDGDLFITQVRKAQ